MINLFVSFFFFIVSICYSKDQIGLPLKLFFFFLGCVFATVFAVWLLAANSPEALPQTGEIIPCSTIKINEL
jgi:hypothetical protein